MTTSGSPPAGNDALTCPACGAENAPGSRFCERCGTRLVARPRAEGESASGTEATQTFALPSSGRPAEPGERTLVGTPMPTPAEAERAPEPEPAQEEAAAPPEPSFRDQPTRSFALPPAAPAPDEEQGTDTPSTDIRNAPTVSFALPQFDQPTAPSATDAPAEATPHGTEATLTGIEPPTAPASQPESPPMSRPDELAAPGWNYQAWTPPPDAGPRDDTPAPAATATQPSLPLISPQQSAAPPAQSPASAGAARPAPAAPGHYPAPAAGAASGPLPSMYPPPGQSPAASAGAYTAPPVTQPVSPYPAPATTSRGGSNRTLWIILGGVAVLFIICALMCVGLLLIGAIGSSAASTTFATSVATAVP